MPKVFRAANQATRAALDAFTARANLGGVGKVRLYTATRPADADTSITDQTLLVEWTLANPAFPVSTDANPGALATASAVSAAAAAATGTASWFRVVSGNGTILGDGNAGTSDSDMILDSLSIVAGQSVAMNSLTITLPEGP